MPRTRPLHAMPHGHVAPRSRRGVTGPGRTITTVGDLVSAAYQVAGSTRGAARLLDSSSPLGHLLDRRIVIA